MKSEVRALLFAAASSAAVALAPAAQAVPVDVLPANPNLAIYFQELPTLTEIPVNLSNTSGQLTTSGTAGSTTVNFTADVNINAASGAATIKPSDNQGVISSLEIVTVGYTFGDLKFGAQLDSESIPGPGGNYLVDLTLAAYNGATLLGTYTFGHPPADKNADQDYLILVEGGPLDMTRVVLSSTIGVLQFKQFELSDLTCTGTNCPPEGPGPGATPLPAAAWLFGSVIAGGIGVSRWRKRRQARTAIA